MNFISRLMVPFLVLLALPALAETGVRLNADPAVIPFSLDRQKTLGIALAPVEAAASGFGAQFPARVVIPPAQVRLVSAPQPGQVEQLMVAVGDRVEQGQVLARLQSPELLSLQRDFLQALSQERLAQSELARDRLLLDEGIIAKRRYLETKSRFDELSAALQERRQVLRLSGMTAAEVAQLEKQRALTTALKVRTPIAGVVLDQHTEVGEKLSSSAPLYRVARLDRLWVEIQVPLEKVKTISMGSAVKINATSDGKVIAVGSDVEPDSQTVLLRAEVANGGFHPGQYVQVALAGLEGENQFRVPASGLTRSGDATVLFVAVDAGFRPLAVQVMTHEGDTAVVTGDLPTNAHVAVGGTAAIKGAWMGLGGGA